MSADYASLLLDAGDYAGRTDFAQHFDRFLRMAETKFNRVIRVADMEMQDDVAIVEGDGTLPADFLEAREVLFSPHCPLRSVSLQVLSARYGVGGGIPQAYSIVGNKIALRPKWSGDLSVTYYATIPPLTAQNPTNWLLTKAPDAYLYGLIEEIALWGSDAEKAAMAQGQKLAALSGIVLLDQRMRWGNSRTSIGGPTP